MSYQEAPTINEILLNREKRKSVSCYTKRPARYSVGDMVEFTFCGMPKIGRISNVECLNGVCSYHIETYNHTWYRFVDQQSIIRKL